MLWEVEVRSIADDPETGRLNAEFDLLLSTTAPTQLLLAAARGYLLEGDISRTDVERLTNDLLHDPVVESFAIREVGADTPERITATVMLKPGVMDPAAMSVVDAAHEMGIPLAAVRTIRRYEFARPPSARERDVAYRRVLANDAIEEVIDGWPRPEHIVLGAKYEFRLVHVPIRSATGVELEHLSRARQLALSLEEMRAVQRHFHEVGREPTDIELETIAQTWSEHCSHKTLKGRVDLGDRAYDNLLKETIFAATQHIRKSAGENDRCISVFEDNAGVVKFDDLHHVVFKVETHNRPSAIEPYGGANTGLGGVIRDVLGTALGARPIANTSIFCFAPPDMPADRIPPGVLHPRKVMRGVVNGVADYGNRTGIPTINGAIVFDERYVANPLVFCGTVGLLPVEYAKKQPRPGDLIVALGGRTGRDGIHGATFSSLGLSHESEKVSGGAVQIGNAITEKKLLDVLMQARDRGLYSAVTDCGAGGFSSAIGEMAADMGATVHLDRALLKYEGLSYTEIWISESQERMVLAVPPESWESLHELCASESVEAVELGRFETNNRLQLYFRGERVGDLPMAFLHDGRPKSVRKAVVIAPPLIPVTPPGPRNPASWATDALKAILASPSVRSKEAVIRRYDHEVLGGTIIKPLVGILDDAPGDAAVITPVLGSNQGLAIACGINPLYGEIDPYSMAAAAIDEAVRNLVAVGADPATVALLDNFCWGNTNDPKTLGALVRACEACRDLAIAFNMPFISGKDSLHNEYRSANRHVAIPGTLLISAFGIVPDVHRAVTMDLKQPGNRLYAVGTTRAELGGSHLLHVSGRVGGTPPSVDETTAPRLFSALFRAISAGLVRSCHDCSEGGLAVAAAEMSFAGGFGADIDLSPIEGLDDETRLFSESATRWLVEVPPEKADAFESVLGTLPSQAVGTVVKEPRLRIAAGGGEWLVWAMLAELKAAWQTPLGM